MGFIAWNPDWQGPWRFFFDFVTLFVFIAVPEEMFFRGLLQNLLEGSWLRDTVRRRSLLSSWQLPEGHAP